MTRSGGACTNVTAARRGCNAKSALRLAVPPGLSRPVWWGYLRRMTALPRPPRISLAGPVIARPFPPSLLDLSPDQARSALSAWVEEGGLPRYRVRQLVRRLWVSPVAAWDAATELPVPLRSELAASHPLPRLQEDVIQQSTEGTRKYL